MKRFRIVLVTLQFLALAIVTLLLAVPSWAQMDGLSSREQIIKWTPLWKGERLPDGRPKVSDDLIKRLCNGTTSEEASWGPIRQAGYLHQWEGGFMTTHPEMRLCGRAFTVRWFPGRPEMMKVINDDAEAKGQSQMNVRTMDMLQQGDVAIADFYNNIIDGVYTGDNLAVSIWARTGNGYVVNGGIRDVEGTAPYPFPVYFRAPWPGTFPGKMVVCVNCPVQIGEVTVMPGDVVLGDREGLTFIPPHLVEAVVKHHEITSLVDDWRKAKYIEAKGSIKPSELYGSIAFQNPAYRKECIAYVQKKFTEKGQKVPVPTQDNAFCGEPPRQSQPPAKKP